MNTKGEETKKDLDNYIAVSWYHKAARRGDVEAQYELGRMYRDGHIVTKSDTEAVKWLQKAADKGFVKAQNDLGFMYENGYGVQRDYTEAV